MAEQRLNENQLDDDVLTETEHSTLDHTGLPGVGTSPNTPTTDEKDALAGTGGSPSAANRYVTDSDSRLVGGADELVKVSANDTTPSTLLSKLSAGANITLTEQNDGGNESILIDAAAGTGGQVDSVGPGTAVTISGTAIDPVVNVTLGTLGTEAAAGDHTHPTPSLSDLSDVSTDEAAAFNAANAPTGANPFATLADTGGGGYGGEVDSVGAGTAISISGTSVDPVVNVTLGTGSSQAAAGNHTHTTPSLSDLSDVSTDEAAAFNGANTPTGANVFATIADVGSGGGQITFDAVVAPSGGDYTTLSAATNAGKKSIRVMPGSYTEPNPVSLPSGTTVIGPSGLHTTGLGQATLDYTIIMASVTRVEGLSFVTSSIPGVQIAGALNRVTVRNCYFQCGPANHIESTGGAGQTSSIFIEKNIFSGQGRHVNLSSSSYSSLNITNNIFKSNTGDSVLVTGDGSAGEGVSIINNFFNNTPILSGVSITSTSNNAKIVNNTIVGNVSDLPGIQSDGDFAIISNNTVENRPAAIVQGEQSIVSGNRSFLVPIRPGIQITATATGAVVTGNISTANQIGIDINGAADCIVTSNYTKGNTAASIQDTGVGTIVANNQI